MNRAIGIGVPSGRRDPARLRPSRLLPTAPAPIPDPGRSRRPASGWIGLAAAYGLMLLILAFGREPGDPPADDDF